jgi:hypothetical protein
LQNSNRERLVRWAEWTVPLVPALLAGAHISGLLFFLNPELPLSPVALMGAAFYYALLLAPLSYAAHIAVARWRRVPVARLVPWSLTVVAAAAALGDGAHASLYAYLLPEAINVQLIKAGLWLAFAAVLLFYTALLHTLHHRRYGPRSRALVAIAVIGSVYSMLDRRTSYRPIELSPPRVRVAAEIEPPSLVVVSLAGGTLDAVLPLASQGKLPFLARALDGGGSARLATPSPPRPAALWTSWATGKMPFRHGVPGAYRYTAPLLGRGARLSLLPLAPAFSRWGLAGGRRVALTTADRNARTVWEILNAAGRASEIVGFASWLGGGGSPVPPASDDPVDAIAVRELRMLGREAFARSFAADRRRFGEARRRLSRERPPSSLFVEVDGFESASLATYGGFAATTFEGRRSTAATSAARAYEAYLSGLDAELALLWDEMAGTRLLVLSSPFGVSPPSGIVRPLTGTDLDLRGSLRGAPDGMLVVRGAGIRAGAQASEGRIVDLVPTLLYAVGLPIARDFDGRVLSELFETGVLQRRALAFVPSYEGLGR